MILGHDPAGLRAVRKYWRGRLGREPEKARAAIAEIDEEPYRIRCRRNIVHRARRAGVMS